MTKDYVYPEEFEAVWGKIEGRGNASPKESAYKLFRRMVDWRLGEFIAENYKVTAKDRVCLGCAKIIDKKSQYLPWHSEQIKAKDKWIKELLDKKYLKIEMECEKCGCTELLCGHNKRE